MTKPNDVPQDVWDVAIAAIGVPDDDNGWHLSEDVFEVISRAIMAEREACAQAVRAVIDRTPVTQNPLRVATMIDEIFAAIRNRSQT